MKTVKTVEIKTRAARMRLASRLGVRGPADRPYAVRPSETVAPSSGFVKSLSTTIERRADKYLDVHDGHSADEPREVEKDLLEWFETQVSQVLDRYVPPGDQRRDRLMFSHFYAEASRAPHDDWKGSLEDRRHTTIKAFIAAEVEARGPLRLTSAQTVRLAGVFKGLASQLSDEALPLHASLAYRRAAELFRIVADHPERDRCMLLHLRAKRQAEIRPWFKIVWRVEDLMAGYGYQPYRMLAWMLGQLVACSALLWLLSREGVVQSFYIACANYLNPLGKGDAYTLPRPAMVTLVVEGYLGALSLGIFFALLVRQWFRG